MRFIVVIMLILVTSCTQGWKVTKSLELRQLVQSSSTVKESRGGFFFFIGSVSSVEYEKVSVKAFAKVDGMYRLVGMPIEEIKINIDNTLQVPNIQIEYWSASKLSNSEVFDSYTSKKFIINCPEKYLPEKLLPISL